MKAKASYFSIRAQLGESFEKLEADAALSLGKKEEAQNWEWAWIWRHELWPKTPKSWLAIEKKDARLFLVSGISKRYGIVTIEAKNGRKKHESKAINVSTPPEELVGLLSRRINKGKEGRWDGARVEIYHPFHQTHPGLAEHAIIGAMKTEKGEWIYALSDRANPGTAAIWQFFGLDPEAKAADGKMMLGTKQFQMAFDAAQEDEEFVWRGERLLKVSLEQGIERLKDIRRFSFRMHKGALSAPIPKNARKFALGEEVAKAERKALPIDMVLSAMELTSKMGKAQRK